MEVKEERERERACITTKSPCLDVNICTTLFSNTFSLSPYTQDYPSWGWEQNYTHT